MSERSKQRWKKSLTFIIAPFIPRHLGNTVRRKIKLPKSLAELGSTRVKNGVFALNKVDNGPNRSKYGLKRAKNTYMDRNSVLDPKYLFLAEFFTLELDLEGRRNGTARGAAPFEVTGGQTLRQKFWSIGPSNQDELHQIP